MRGKLMVAEKGKRSVLLLLLLLLILLLLVLVLVLQLRSTHIRQGGGN